MQGKNLYIFRHAKLPNQVDESGRRIIRAANTAIGQEGSQEFNSLLTTLQRNKVEIEKVYCTGIRRVVDSALLVKEAFHTPYPAIKPDIVDIFGADLYPEWRDKPLDEWEAVTKSKQQRPPQGVVQQITALLQEILSQPEEHISLVSHGSVARVAVFLLERPGEEIPTLGELAKIYDLERSECFRMQLDAEGHVVNKQRFSAEGARNKKEIGW